MTEYYDATDGELIYEYQLYERYDDLLDEIYDEAVIGYGHYLPSEILKNLGPVDYRIGYAEWLDRELYDDKRIFEIDGKRFDLCHECACEVVNGDLSGRDYYDLSDEERALRDAAIELMGNATVAVEGVSTGEFDCWVCGEAQYGDATIFDGENKA